MQESTKEAILRIDNTLRRIENIIGKKSSTTNKTRIGALNRISEAIKCMSKRQESQPERYVDAFDEIRNILLGIN